MRELTRAQLVKIDHLVDNKYNIPTLILMENAGGRLFKFLNEQFPYLISKLKILILAGPGNNGGDGLVLARYLHNRGYQVIVVLVTDNGLSKLSQKQCQILETLRVKILKVTQKNYKLEPIKNLIKDHDLLIDCLLGYNIKGNPRGSIAKLIQLINESKKQVVAGDIPSGLDPNTGKAYIPTVKAHYTLTFGALKKGFLDKKARKYLGKLFLADIGIPPELYKFLKIKDYPKFRETSILRIF